MILEFTLGFIILLLMAYFIYFILVCLYTISADTYSFFYWVFTSFWFPFFKDILIIIVMEPEAFYYFSCSFILLYGYLKLEHLIFFMVNISTYIICGNIWFPLFYLFIPLLRCILEYLKDILTGVEPDILKYICLFILYFTLKIVISVGFNLVIARLLDFEVQKTSVICSMVNPDSPGTSVNTASNVTAYVPKFTDLLYADSNDGPNKVRTKGYKYLREAYYDLWPKYRYEVESKSRGWPKVCWDLYYVEKMCKMAFSLREPSWEFGLVLKYYSQIPHSFTPDVLDGLGAFGSDELFYRERNTPAFKWTDCYNLEKVHDQARELRIELAERNTTDPLILERMRELTADSLAPFSFNKKIESERIALQDLIQYKKDKIPLKSWEVKGSEFFLSLDNYIYKAGEHPISTSQVGLGTNIHTLNLNPNLPSEAGPSNRRLPSPTQVAFTRNLNISPQITLPSISQDPNLSSQITLPSISQDPNIKRNWDEGPGMDDFSEGSNGKRRRIE